MMNENFEILIIDNSEENIKITKRILHNNSYNFSKAFSAKEAIELLKNKRFDLIMLDVYLPDTDGFKLCKIIKSSPVIKDTPVFSLQIRMI